MRKCTTRNAAFTLHFYVLSLAISCMAPQFITAQESVPQPDKIFQDTTGGYGYMYLSTSCFDCNPKGLVFYKKFVVISGFYKTKDFYSSIATRSVDHFEGKFRKQGYFIDKKTDIWKSPYLFTTYKEAKEFRDELITKLKKEDYKVLVFDDFISTEDLGASSQ